MSKRKHDETVASPQAGDLTLYESTPIHDRSSIFRAIFTPDAGVSPKNLQKHQPFESAMHKIVAWRKPSAQRSLVSSFGASSSSSSSQQQSRIVCETGSDEDGEKYAGKKVEKVLMEMNVQGVVVVARWYGGTLLGPVRFKWIEDCAREAILMWKKATGIANGSGGELMEGAKKAKTDGAKNVQDERKEVDRLVRLLPERDASVKVLRSLLAEKNDELKRLESMDEDGDPQTLEARGREADQMKSPGAATPDYTSMPLQRLKQLEKARDATLEWVLKQIDGVEDKIKSFDVQKADIGGQIDDATESSNPKG